MNEQAMRFRFGVFVLASLILLAVLTILFGGFPNYFKRTQEYTIVFTNAPGIAPGTPVRRSGVRIGEVQTVELDSKTGEVHVAISVEDKYFLRKGDRATLTQGLIGGDAAIAFAPPDLKKPVDDTPVEPGAVLQGVSPLEPGSLLQNTADLVGPAKDTLIEIRKVFQGIDKLGPIVEETLKDFREIGKLTKTVGPEVQKTAEEIRLLAKTTREAIPEVRRTNDDIGRAARNWGNVGERVDVLLKTNEDKIVKSVEKMEDTLKRVNLLFSDENIKNVREAVKGLRDGSVQFDGLAKETGELLKDGRGTLKQMNLTMKHADEAMLDLQKAMKPFGERGPAVFKNFEDSTDSLNKTLKDVRDLIQAVARSEGTINKLIFDPGLYNNLNDSAEMMTKILPRLDQVLRDAEIFADKLARHPELIGFGGVVRPSSGLKESPSNRPYRVYP